MSDSHQIVLLEEENTRLLERIETLEQEKWQLEDAVADHKQWKTVAFALSFLVGALTVLLFAGCGTTSGTTGT